VTNPFAPLSSAGSWLKPAERNGHLLIIANAQFVGRKYDEMRKQDVDVVKFDMADLSQAGEGWLTGVQSTHAGVVNKLTGILGNPEGKVLGVIGQVAANNGHLAWVLGDAPAEAVQGAVAWLNANPAPAAAPAFAPLPAAPVNLGQIAQAAVPVVAAAQPTQAQGDVADLLAKLQAAHQG
jgi:hypothetical protein